MNRPTCPTCGKSGVQTRTSKNGRKYQANVQTYDSGASYFRSLHTDAECDAFVARIKTQAAEALAREEAAQAEYDRNRRADVLIRRYIAIFGQQAAATSWETLAQRWLGKVAA